MRIRSLIIACFLATLLLSCRQNRFVYDYLSFDDPHVSGLYLRLLQSDEDNPQKRTVFYKKDGSFEDSDGNPFNWDVNSISPLFESYHAQLFECEVSRSGIKGLEYVFSKDSCLYGPDAEISNFFDFHLIMLDGNPKITDVILVTSQKTQNRATNEIESVGEIYFFIGSIEKQSNPENGFGQIHLIKLYKFTGQLDNEGKMKYRLKKRAKQKTQNLKLLYSQKEDFISVHEVVQGNEDNKSGKAESFDLKKMFNRDLIFVKN